MTVCKSFVEKKGEPQQPGIIIYVQIISRLD